MRHSDKLRPFESFIMGVSIITAVASLITHPEGSAEFIERVTWAIDYQPDWEYHVSQFTD